VTGTQFIAGRAVVSHHRVTSLITGNWSVDIAGAKTVDEVDKALLLMLVIFPRFHVVVATVLSADSTEDL